MSAITNEDIFYSLYTQIQQGATYAQILKDFGGGVIYIPSYKSTQRDEDVWEDYQDMLKQNLPKKRIMLTLQQKYDLSHQRLYNILKAKKQPKLF